MYFIKDYLFSNIREKGLGHLDSHPFDTKVLGSYVTPKQPKNTQSDWFLKKIKRLLFYWPSHEFLAYSHRFLIKLKKFGPYMTQKF